MRSAFHSASAADEVRRLYLEVLKGWPVANEHIRLDTREGETFVVACGARRNPPLVLLHGAQANAATWMFDAALWSKAFRVYAVDVIGEAGLSAPSRPRLDSEAHALWLDDVMQGLGIARAAFVGVSLGGWLTLDYAARRPGKVERMALLCPAGIGRQRNFLLEAIPLMLLGPWGLRKMREMVFGPLPADLPPAAKPLIELLTLIGHTIRPRIVTIPRLTDPQLRSLTMPMLVILGGKDVLLDSKHTKQRLASEAPHADVRLLPDARHFIPGQAPAIFEFLQEKPAARRRQN